VITPRKIFPPCHCLHSSLFVAPSKVEFQRDYGATVEAPGSDTNRSSIVGRLGATEPQLPFVAAIDMIRKVNTGSNKDQLTRASFASDFDEIDDYDEREKDVNQRVDDVNQRGEENDGESDNKISNSNENAIATDQAYLWEVACCMFGDQEVPLWINFDLF
jgi:hypothetical protein